MATPDKDANTLDDENMANLCAAIDLALKMYMGHEFNFVVLATPCCDCENAFPLNAGNIPTEELATYIALSFEPGRLEKGITEANRIRASTENEELTNAPTSTNLN